MGHVTKTVTEKLGDATITTSYQFETLDDFLRWSGLNAPNQVEKIFGVAGRRYRVIDNVLGHGFEVGEVVEALARDYSGHINVSNGEKKYWMSKEELEEV